MGVYPDIEPSCPKFHRSTPKGPTAKVLYYLRTTLPAFGLPEPVFTKNYYKLSLKERIRSKPELQGLADEVHDALKAYLLKITGIETAAALVHLTAGVLQLISSSIALKKSQGFESALHVTSIVTGVLSIISSIIEGIAIPPIVKSTFDKITKAVSDTVAVLVDLNNDEIITASEGRKIEEPIRFLATGVSRQGLATKKPNISVIQTAADPLTPINPMPPVSSVAVSTTTAITTSTTTVASANVAAVVSSTSSFNVTPTTTTTTATITTMTPVQVVSPVVDEDVPTDNRVRHQIGVHFCTDVCQCIIVNKRDQEVKWYLPTDWEDTIRLLFGSQNSQYISDISKTYPDFDALEEIGLQFHDVHTTGVSGCTRNAVFFHDHSIGLTDEYFHRPIAPGFLYDEKRLTFKPWALGAYNIRQATDKKFYWDPDMENLLPFAPIKIGVPKDVVHSLSKLRRITVDEASSSLNKSPWVDNHSLGKAHVKDHKGPIFVTHGISQMYDFSKMKVTVVYPYKTQAQSKQDWSKLAIGLVATTMCAVGVGMSPSRGDILKWVNGANQSAALIKNGCQAQDFIINQLAGLETSADEELEKRYKELCLEADNLLAIPPSIFTARVDLVNRYEAWNNAFDRFLRDARSSKSKTTNWYVRTLQSKQHKLSELWVNVNQCYHSGKKRTPTVLIELTGKPGIGKTTAIERFIIPALAKMMGDISTACFHWQINHNGHVNNYGGELFSSYDEFRARGSDDPMFQYLNHICSDPAFLVPSAFEKDRNFMARVLFLTSNSGKTDLSDLVTGEAEKAINSRIKTYRIEHPEVENLMETLGTREVTCDRSPETFNYFRRTTITPIGKDKRPRDVEIQISYKDFLIDVYTLMWQQHNNHPPLAVDDNIRSLLTSWTGFREPTFSEGFRTGRQVSLANDEIPPLVHREVEQPMTFTPHGVTSQASSEHFVVNLRGHSGRGKTRFMEEIEHLFPRLLHTKIHRVDLTNRDTWIQAFAYWIDDQVIANQQEYLDFYNQLSQPSVIFLTSNLVVRDKKLSLLEGAKKWWCGNPSARVLDQITVEGVKRRLGLGGVILLNDHDKETVFSSIGTFLEAEIEKPGLVRSDDQVLSKDKFIIKLGDAIRNWREHEQLYVWADDVGVDLPTEPDICITAETWGALKTMLSSGKSMWDNLSHERVGGNSIFVTPELTEKLKKKNEIVVDFWKLHPSLNSDQQDFTVESIFTLYRQVDSESVLLLKIGDSIYWNRDQSLFKRGRSKETVEYSDDGENLSISFSLKEELVDTITIRKGEYVRAMCEGFLHSSILLNLAVSRQDLILLHADHVMSQPYMSAYVTQHLEAIQIAWYEGAWIKAKKFFKKMWKEHPVFLVAAVLCTLWAGWQGLTQVYSKIKTCITGKTEWRCPCCSYLHSFNKAQTKCFLTRDYKYCPNCRSKYALTHEGELLSTHRLCEQTKAWQDETFNEKAAREVKCPIAENQSPTSLADNDTAWRSGALGTVRPAKWQKARTKVNPNTKYAPPLTASGVPDSFTDKWIENWELPTDDWELQGKQEHYHSVLKVVRENMCSVHGVLTTKAMFLRDKYVIYPWHAHSDSGMTVKSDGKYWDLIPVYEDSSADIAISKVADKRFPAKKDITRYLLPATAIDKVSSGMIVLYHDYGYDSISGSLRFIQECKSHYFDESGQKVNQNLLSLNSVSMAMGGLHPEVGDCGNPYIAMTGNAQCLVGFHISYSYHTSTSYAAAMVKENIQGIIRDHETRVQQAGQKEITSFRLPVGQYYATQDFLQYIDTIRPEDGNVVLPPERCFTLGKGPKTIFPRKNSMFHRTPFSKYIEDDLPVEKIPVSAKMTQVQDFSDLLTNRKGQYCFMTTQMATCTSSFEGDVGTLEKAENLVQMLMSAHYGNKHRTLNQHEVLNGIPGISPVTLDTGAGIICEKSHKIMLKKDAIVYDGVYKFRDNEKGNALRERYKHDLEMIHSEKAPAYLFKAELKSECLPIDKANKGKIRLFNNAGTELILVERHLSGHIAASISQQSGPIFIGKDPLLHFDEYLKNMQFTHHIDIDVKRWDKSVLPAIISRGCRVLARLHSDPNAIKWYATLFKIIGYPLVQFDETLAQLVGTIPSGMYHTALLGSVCHMIVCMYALIKSLPSDTNPLHGGYLLVCADDLVYLHDGKDVDLELFEKAYLECGISIQHPDKVGGEIRSALASEPILFCSRTIRKSKGRWFPSLNWSSLTSCLHYTKEKGSLGLENILKVVQCESYALEKEEYDRISAILFKIYTFLQIPSSAAAIPCFETATSICRNFIIGQIEDRAGMLTGCSSSQTVNKILNLDLGEQQGKPKRTVRIDKVPVKQFQQAGRMGTEHPRTRFLQSGRGPVRDFEEHIKAASGRFECTLTVEGENYTGDGSNYAAASRAAWDSYEHARPAPTVSVPETVDTIPASHLHPKTRCNTYFQKSGKSRPRVDCIPSKTGWTCTISENGNDIVRSSKDKKTSEFLAWDVYYVSLCQKEGIKAELSDYLATGFSKARKSTTTSSVDSKSTSSTPQADSNSSNSPWSLGSFRNHFLGSQLYGASLRDVEVSFLKYIMGRYQPGCVPSFEFAKLKTAAAMTTRRNFPIATESEVNIIIDMCLNKCELELQLWAKLSSEMSNEEVDKLFRLHDTYSTPQGDNQYDIPPVPSSYLPMATTMGVRAPIAVPALGVPMSYLSHGGIASDIVDIMTRDIWSPCIPISPSDPAGTVLLNISWAECTNWGITQFFGLHKKAAGEIFVTVMISGANQCTGMLRLGLLMENNPSPTIADLECVQNFTLGLNGDQVATFPLKFVSQSQFFMDTDNLPDYPRIVCVQESSISNMYGSTSPAAQLKYAYDACARDMTPEGKYVKNNLGLSFVVADCRTPSTSLGGSISAAGVAMTDIFPGEEFINMCTDGRTVYTHNTCDITVKPDLPSTHSDFCPGVDLSGVPFMQDYYNGTNKIFVNVDSMPSFRSVRPAKGGNDAYYDHTGQSDWDGLYIVRGQHGVYKGNAATTGVTVISAVGTPSTFSNTEIADRLEQKIMFAEANGAFSPEVKKYVQTANIIMMGYTGKGERVTTTFAAQLSSWFILYNGMSYYSYAIKSPDIIGMSANQCMPFQGATTTIPCDVGGQLSTVASTMSLERNCAYFEIDLGTSLPIAVSSTGLEATSLPPQYTVVRFLDTVPSLIQTANGQSFQASVHLEHRFKQWLISHTNAKSGDILHFNLGRRGFAESLADVRMMVLDTVSSSYLVIKGPQQYSWFGSVKDTIVRNLIKVGSAALLTPTDQSSWVSMMANGELETKLQAKKRVSPESIARLMLEDPEFRRLTSRFTSTPQAGMTKREIAQVNLGKFCSPRQSEWFRRVQTIEKYEQYREIEDDNIRKELAERKSNIEMSLEAQDMYRFMQAHLVAKQDADHDPMIKNNAWKTHMADSISSVNFQLSKMLMKIEQLTELLAASRALQLPTVRDAIIQAGLDNSTEASDKCSKGKRITSTPQAEVAALAMSGAMQGVSSGIGNYFNRKFQKQMLQQSWDNASEMQKIKGKQMLQQELLKGGIGFAASQRLQQQNFNNQVSLTGMQGASRLAMSRQQGVNQLNVEKYKKTGTTADPPGPTAEAGTTMHHDMGVGTAPKAQAPSPPISSTGSGPDELEANYHMLTSTGMMKEGTTPSAAAPTAAQSVSLASTSDEGESTA